MDNSNNQGEAKRRRVEPPEEINDRALAKARGEAGELREGETQGRGRFLASNER